MAVLVHYFLYHDDDDGGGLLCLLLLNALLGFIPKHSRQAGRSRMAGKFDLPNGAWIRHFLSCPESMGIESAKS